MKTWRKKMRTRDWMALFLGLALALSVNASCRGSQPWTVSNIETLQEQVLDLQARVTALEKENEK